VTHSVAPNQLLKSAGLLKTRPTTDGALIDYENSDAFALVDHQIAHVYLKAAADRTAVGRALEANPSIQIIEKSEGLSHPRAGQLQLQASPGSWFDYRWWQRPEDAPSFATMVDIHRKPGYDPLELFLQPGTRSITQDASLIQGSHGALPGSEGLLIGATPQASIEMTAVAFDVLQLLQT